MKRDFAIFRQVENWFLVRLLVRFAARQIVANTGRSSELVDCATVIIDEVGND